VNVNDGWLLKFASTARYVPPTITQRVVVLSRRQLLEYLMAFGADGALVVDMVAGEVREVEFPGLLGGG
jgi:hypothetical protein